MEFGIHDELCPIEKSQKASSLNFGQVKNGPYVSAWDNKGMPRRNREAFTKGNIDIVPDEDAFRIESTKGAGLFGEGHATFCIAICHSRLTSAFRSTGAQLKAVSFVLATMIAENWAREIAAFR